MITEKEKITNMSKVKKIISILCIFITFLVIYFLQVNFFSWFNIVGIKPNLFIIYVMFLGLFLGKEYGLVLGVVFGLILDMFISQYLGISAIMLGISGLLSGILVKNFSRTSRFTVILLTSGLTILIEVIKYIFIIILGNADIQLITFSKILTIEILYNAIIVIIIYPLFQKSGEKLEQILKEKPMAIRYF